ncbi:hypothetical protein UJ101_02482 [Flavobacteriaceae bacterium UJ101]|nr:hypothetical protein UJ101_02482 [Flavobacteriaceae bacterium UJ101]
MNFTEINWSLILDILKSISVIIVSIVAIFGINSWRRETKWKRKYQLAEDTLSLFYEVKDSISIIRNPFSYTTEGNTRKKKENESIEETERLNRAYIILERFNDNKEPFYKLRTIKYRFITVFGKEYEKCFSDIDKIMNEIITASHFLGTRYWKDQGRKKFTEEEFEKHLERMHKYESCIWENYENDEINKQLNQIITQIEKVCFSILKKNNL